MNVNPYIQMLPHSEHHLKRLDNLLKGDTNKPKIAVFGKYNHGKSTLLNAIVGDEHFAAADKRQTMSNESFENKGVVWVDTPGLDADVHGKDDAAAIEGAFQIADYIFLVHQITAGELDKYELEIYQKLAAQGNHANKKMCLVLTQIDQKGTEEIVHVTATIKKQLQSQTSLQEINVIPVSAIRYARGINENKPIFCERSGMVELFALIEKLKTSLITSRKTEITQLKTLIETELKKAKDQIKVQLDNKRNELHSYRQNFKQDLEKTKQEIQARG